MSTFSLYRLSGLALVAGAVLASLGYWLRSGVLDLGAYGMPAYLPSAMPRFSGELLVLIGLPGMYAFQSSRAGKLGLIGFASTFLGLAILEISTTPLYAFVPPWLASAAATQSLAAQPGAMETQLRWAFAATIVTGLVALNLGTILYAIAILRARVFSRWAAIALLVGVPAIFFLSNLSPIIGGEPAILVLLGFGWCGYARLASRAQPAPSPA